MTQTENLVTGIEAAALRLADAVSAEQAIEDARINVKMAAVGRIMHSGDNPLTGKAHSFSSAEALVNTDEEYQQYLERQRNAVRERILAKGAYDAAVASARLHANHG
jgi:hypothetical protein